MSPELNGLSLIALIGAVHGLVLSLILLSLNQNRLANRLLSLFVLCFSLMMIENVVFETRFFLVLPHVSMTFGLLIFSLPPLFYLYVKSLTIPHFSLGRADALHFIPLVVFFLLHLPFFMLSPEEKIAEMLSQYEISSIRFYQTFLDPTFYQVSIYFLLSFRLIERHSVLVKDHYSSEGKRNLKWLRYFFFVCFGIWATSLLSQLFGLSLRFPIENLFFSAAVYALGYFSMRQPEVFTALRLPQAEPPIGASATPSPETELKPKKYEKSTLTEDAAAALQHALVSTMTEKKPYLNPELTLQDLSELLGVSTHHLSQVLNERLRQTFFDFVNSYRVESVKEKLLSPKHRHLTVLAIAFDSGFNSKTAFNSAFKKHTGATPSDFRKNHRQSDLI